MLLGSDFDASEIVENWIITAADSLVLFEIKTERTGRFNGSKYKFIFVLTFRMYSKKITNVTTRNKIV